MNSFIKFFVCIGFFLLLTACSDRNDAIDDLQELVEDIRQNGSEYTAEQWADAEGIFEEVNDELDQYKYTQSEKKRISELKGQYFGYLGKRKMEEKVEMVKELIYQVKGAGEAVKSAMGDLSDEFDDKE